MHRFCQAPLKEVVSTSDASSESQTGGFLSIYRFATADDLVEGWQVHVARQRVIHEYAARRLQSLHYWLGVPATAFAAAAGSSAVAGWQTDSIELAVAGGLVGLAATILVSTLTFLDLGARAEQHRQASRSYKRMLRRLERFPSAAKQLATLEEESHPLFAALERLEVELADVDANAPVPPRRLASQIERRPTQVLHGINFADPTNRASGVRSPGSSL